MAKQEIVVEAGSPMGVLKTVLVPLVENADPDAGEAQVRGLLELAQATVEYAQMLMWKGGKDESVKL